MNRNKFFIVTDETDPARMWVVVTAESITDAIDDFISARSPYQNFNEANVKNGMWHWHWTLYAGAPTEAVRRFLIGAGLTEAADFRECW